MLITPIADTLFPIYVVGDQLERTSQSIPILVRWSQPASSSQTNIL